MDTNRLQKIFENYAEKFQTFNTAEAHEIYKWSAVSRFQKYWDLDAENFGEMFKTAMDGDDNLISEASYQPINGVVFLCKHSKDIQELVRDEFRKLLAPDDSDYDAREKRAEAFVTAMNQLLLKVDENKWKYHQEISSALMYLNFADPDDNYLYKENEVKTFAEYVDFEDEIVREDGVNLSAYYSMCDEVGEELEQQSDLLQLVDDALQDEADSIDDSSVTEIDGSNHILVFDIIYCAQNYDLYDEEVSAQKKKKRRKKTLTAAEAEKAKEDAELKKKLRNARTKLRKAEDKRNELHFPELTGKGVQHKKYGQGKVTGQDGKYLTVAFDTGEKKFILPDALLKGFLTTEDDGCLETCKQISELDKTIHALDVERNLLEVQINGLDN